MQCQHCSDIFTLGWTDGTQVLCSACFNTSSASELPGDWRDTLLADGCVECGALLNAHSTGKQLACWSGTEKGAIVLCDQCVENFNTLIKDEAVLKLEHLIGKT